MKKKLLSLAMSIAIGLSSLPFMKAQTADAAWWWQRDVFLWRIEVDGCVVGTYGPQRSYRVIFANTDLNTFWYGYHIGYHELNRYFCPATTVQYSLVTVDKSFLNNRFTSGSY